MLAKRIIPCLDVKDGHVIKGIKFQNHVIVGDILSLAEQYVHAGADELVLYDITASSSGYLLDKRWVYDIAKIVDIPFCVAGGIDSVKCAGEILAMGADKVSINSPALANPHLISELSRHFGQQCVVVGIDSYYDHTTNTYQVHQYTGDHQRTRITRWQTQQWIQRVQALGAGEIVLNCMNQDGVRQGYDVKQLATLRPLCQIPLIASGGAGSMADFKNVFQQADVDGALAASVFHHRDIDIMALKSYLAQENITVRLTS